MKNMGTFVLFASEVKDCNSDENYVATVRIQTAYRFHKPYIISMCHTTRGIEQSISN